MRAEPVMDLHDLRREYEGTVLHRADLDPDPFRQFEAWFRQAEQAGEALPNAMTLATVDGDGRPSARVVLLKGVEDGAFVFYTDYGSRKAREIGSAGRVALVFHWQTLHRQVCLSGTATRGSREGAEAYFRSRPRDAQLSALASRQSAPVPDRAALEGRVRDLTAEFAGRELPMKEEWGGFRVVPDEFQFWQGRESRLHDRFRYLPSGAGWSLDRLCP